MIFKLFVGNYNSDIKLRSENDFKDLTEQEFYDYLNHMACDTVYDRFTHILRIYPSSNKINISTFYPPGTTVRPENLIMNFSDDSLRYIPTCTNCVDCKACVDCNKCRVCEECDSCINCEYCTSLGNECDINHVNGSYISPKLYPILIDSDSE